MASAWDFGPGNQDDSSLSWAEFTSTALNTVKAVASAKTTIENALGGTTTPAATSTQPAPPKSDNGLILILGIGALIWFVAK